MATVIISVFTCHALLFMMAKCPRGINEAIVVDSIQTGSVRFILFADQRPWTLHSGQKPHKSLFSHKGGDLKPGN